MKRCPPRAHAPLGLTSARGFSLIEIMIVVAIIGMLTTIAVPNMQRFQARSRSAEAKVQLKGLMTDYWTYWHDTGEREVNLRLLGWKPVGTPRYIYGFTAGIISDPGGVPDSASLAAVEGGFSTEKMVTNAGVALVYTDLPFSFTFGGIFGSIIDPPLIAIGAAGNVDDDDTLDRWAITNYPASMAATYGVAAEGQFFHVTDDIAD